MADKAASSAEKQWRDKYLALHEEHKSLKTALGDRNEQLRRGLVMVSLLAEGQADDLDGALGGMRDSMKGTTLSFSNAINQLDAMIRKFDGHYDQQSGELATHLVAMAEKLCQCPLPKDLITQIRELRKSASKDLQSWGGYVTQLNGWAGVLNNIAALDGADSKQSGGWLSRWFRSEQSTETLPDAPELPETQSSVQERVENPSQDPVEAGDKETEPGFSRIAKEVADTIGALISRLVIPERMEATAETLQERLANGVHWYEFVALLEDTSQFLLDCLGSGQEEFERFLSSLDKRLQAIQVLVADANTGASDRERARVDLENMVRDQIADIRSVVNGLGDLGELGSSIRDHLALIVKAMEQYQKVENEREARLAEQLQVLLARLNEMEAEASQARQIIEDQRTRATQDHLTGLPNRAAYDIRLNEELLKKSRTGGSLSVIVCDVDHFKKINDTYGHLAGDKVLQLLASTLRKHLRNGDFIARYGGEEFVALLPGATADDALMVAEKLRERVQACPFNFRGERVTITMSFGISEYRTLEAPETVFERTDKALYKAKESGRNCCVKA